MSAVDKRPKSSAEDSDNEDTESEESAESLTIVQEVELQTPRRKINKGLSERLSVFQSSKNSPIEGFSESFNSMPSALVTPKRTPNAGTKFMASKNALLQALTSPAQKPNPLSLEERTPRTLKRGFVALNVASPQKQTLQSPTPPKRFTDDVQSKQDKTTKYIDACMNVLQDKTRGPEVEKLVRKIEVLDGFPTTRRLSMRDNELVSRLVMAVRNDPRITHIHADQSVFGTISSTLLEKFVESLRLNLHVTSLRFQAVELGNDFLYSLAASMESNFVVEEIDLSTNCFTNEGLANFCQSVAANNESLKKLNLSNQTTPISAASEEDVLDSFRENKSLIEVKLDFLSEDGPRKLEEILQRNRALEEPERVVSVDDKLIGALEYEADRAQEVWENQQEEEHSNEEQASDWDYLYDLSVLFDKRKLKKEVEENETKSSLPERRNADDLSAEEKKRFLFGAFKKTMEESVSCFNSDGSFLTDEFIAKYFNENPEEDAIDFDFHGQWKLFKRFPMHDPARQLIVDKFVDALVAHPRANELTGINMAATGCGDDFVIALCNRCLEDSSLLPNLHSVNFETNFINEAGIVALSKLIASQESCRFMQVIRLENQKNLLKSKAEFALAKALRVNRSIVVVSLVVRNLLERQRIANYIVRNVDCLREARQRKLKASGAQRKRNAIEEVFDQVRENDESITTVKMTGKERFLTLTREEKIKAASSFANNDHVKEIIFNSCCIDDDFAKALAQTFPTNSSIEKVSLESNDISGTGIRALFEGLNNNQSIRELRLHKQSKIMASADEDVLAEILEANTTLVKLGIDLRSKKAQVELDRKMTLNQNLVLKEKALAKGGEYVATDSIVALKL